MCDFARLCSFLIAGKRLVQIIDNILQRGVEGHVKFVKIEQHFAACVLLLRLRSLKNKKKGAFVFITARRLKHKKHN
jgi:hypothetical protein